MSKTYTQPEISEAGARLFEFAVALGDANTVLMALLATYLALADENRELTEVFARMALKAGATLQDVAASRAATTH